MPDGGAKSGGWNWNGAGRRNGSQKEIYR